MGSRSPEHSYIYESDYHTSLSYQWYLLIEGVFILLYLPSGKFVKLRVHGAWCRTELGSHGLAFVQSLVDGLTPAEHRAEFRVCGHLANGSARLTTLTGGDVRRPPPPPPPTNLTSLISPGELTNIV